jgi:biotin transport system substrate-specific component
MELIKELKQSKIIRNVFLALMGTVLLSVSAKIKIPFYPVPMTMQTLVVIFLGIALGWKLGIATVTLYLFEGIIGLPVFAGSPEKGIGIVYFTGPTMGYLIGFLFTVYFAGSFKFSGNLFKRFLTSLQSFLKLSFNNQPGQFNHFRREFKLFGIELILFGKDFLKLIFSVSFIYILGILWLGTLIGWQKPLFQLGVQPFLLAELFKVLIVLFSLSKIKKLNLYL